MRLKRFLRIPVELLLVFSLLLTLFAITVVGIPYQWAKFKFFRRI